MTNNTSHLCPVCNEVKDLTEFAGRKNKRGEPYPSSYCRSCQSEYNRKWRAKNGAGENARKRELYKSDPTVRKVRQEDTARRYAANPSAWRGYSLKKFGITLAEYQTMLAAQNGVCAICSESCKSGRDLAVDHDHATGKVRALLCIRCNNGLGNFRDSLELLTSATRYLADHQ